MEFMDLELEEFSTFVPNSKLLERHLLNGTHGPMIIEEENSEEDLGGSRSEWILNVFALRTSRDLIDSRTEFFFKVFRRTSDEILRSFVLNFCGFTWKRKKKNFFSRNCVQINFFSFGCALIYSKCSFGREFMLNYGYIFNLLIFVFLIFLFVKLKYANRYLLWKKIFFDN